MNSELFQQSRRFRETATATADRLRRVSDALHRQQLDCVLVLAEIVAALQGRTRYAPAHVGDKKPAMIKTAGRVEELRAIGVVAPARPDPPFDAIPLNPCPEQLALDRDYQARCAAWIEAVATLYREHFPAAR